MALLYRLNIFPGSFIQFAADNNDINEETLDGKNTTHATTLVVYQKKPFGPMPPPEVHADHADKRRSLQSASIHNDNWNVLHMVSDQLLKISSAN